MFILCLSCVHPVLEGLGGCEDGTGETRQMQSGGEGWAKVFLGGKGGGTPPLRRNDNAWSGFIVRIDVTLASKKAKTLHYEGHQEHDTGTSHKRLGTM